jgi:hypothetical protein
MTRVTHRYYLEENMSYELLAHSIRTDLVTSARDRDRLFAQMIGLRRTEAKRHGGSKLVRYFSALRHHPS